MERPPQALQSLRCSGKGKQNSVTSQRVATQWLRRQKVRSFPESDRLNLVACEIHRKSRPAKRIHSVECASPALGFLRPLGGCVVQGTVSLRKDLQAHQLFKGTRGNLPRVVFEQPDSGGTLTDAAGFAACRKPSIRQTCTKFRRTRHKNREGDGTSLVGIGSNGILYLIFLHRKAQVFFGVLH